MSTAKSTALVALLFVTLMVAIAAAVTAPAQAHVRDKDKHALCSGAYQDRRHFHDGGIQSGYYFHIHFRYRDGNYIHYSTYKTGRLGYAYDRHKKIVNCRYW